MFQLLPDFLLDQKLLQSISTPCQNRRNQDQVPYAEGNSRYPPRHHDDCEIANDNHWLTFIMYNTREGSELVKHIKKERVHTINPKPIIPQYQGPTRRGGEGPRHMFNAPHVSGRAHLAIYSQNVSSFLFSLLAGKFQLDNYRLCSALS